MPIDEVGASFFGAIFRFFGWILFEVVIEVLIKGLGVLLCRPFRKMDVESATATIVGLVAWVLIIIMVVSASDWLVKFLEIDSCLDRGGRLNYERNICEFGQ